MDSNNLRADWICTGSRLASINDNITLYLHPKCSCCNPLHLLLIFTFWDRCYDWCLLGQVSMINVCSVAPNSVHISKRWMTIGKAAKRWCSTEKDKKVCFLNVHQWIIYMFFRTRTVTSLNQMRTDKSSNNVWLDCWAAQWNKWLCTSNLGSAQLMAKKRFFVSSCKVRVLTPEPLLMRWKCCTSTVICTLIMG